MLHVGETRSRCIDRAFGLRNQGRLELSDPRGDLTHVIAKVEPKICRDLVVAAPSGAQLPAQRSDAFEQTALERSVNVLIVGGGPEPSLSRVVVQLVERAEHASQLVVVEQIRPMKNPGVSARSKQIVRR
jgi:hypothetical protein